MIDCRIVGVNGWFVSRSLRLRSLVESFLVIWHLARSFHLGFGSGRTSLLGIQAGMLKSKASILPRLSLTSIFPKSIEQRPRDQTFKPYSTALFKSDRHCLGTSSNSRSLKNSSNLLLCMSRFLPGLVVYLAYTPYRPGSCRRRRRPAEPGRPPGRAVHRRHRRHRHR